MPKKKTTTKKSSTTKKQAAEKITAHQEKQQQLEERHNAEKKKLEVENQKLKKQFEKEKQSLMKQLEDAKKNKKTKMSDTNSEDDEEINLEESEDDEDEDDESKEEVDDEEEEEEEEVEEEKSVSKKKNNNDKKAVEVTPKKNKKTADDANSNLFGTPAYTSTKTSSTKTVSPSAKEQYFLCFNVEKKLSCELHVKSKKAYKCFFQPAATEWNVGDVMMVKNGVETIREFDQDMNVCLTIEDIEARKEGILCLKFESFGMSQQAPNWRAARGHLADSQGIATTNRLSIVAKDCPKDVMEMQRGDLIYLFIDATCYSDKTKDSPTKKGPGEYPESLLFKECPKTNEYFYFIKKPTLIELPPPGVARRI
jgi:hypothetical protein